MEEADGPPKLSIVSSAMLTKTTTEQHNVHPSGAMTERIGSEHSEFPSLYPGSTGSKTARRGVPRELSEREFRRKEFSTSSKVTRFIRFSRYSLMILLAQIWSDRLGSMHSPRNPR